jgi:predicted short-subunit dehydrogenase-like oxidoreductase (DUF2520 family)
MSAVLKRIVLLGTGNTAHALASRIAKSTELDLVQVWGRNAANATALAHKYGCDKPISELKWLFLDADIYILAISDGAILHLSDALAAILPATSLVVHCAGARPTSDIHPKFKRSGVLYPLQTLSKETVNELTSMPLLVTATQSDDLTQLQNLANLLTDRVSTVSDDDRLRYHLAAVLVNNFSNHFFQQADHFLNTEGLDFNVLRPLINETVLKIDRMSPFDAQTGPARRNDVVTLKKHRGLLQNHTELLKSYRLLSKQIRKKYRGTN